MVPGLRGVPEDQAAVVVADIVPLRDREEQIPPARGMRGVWEAIMAMAVMAVAIIMPAAAAEPALSVKLCRPADREPEELACRVLLAGHPLITPAAAAAADIQAVALLSARRVV